MYVSINEAAITDSMMILPVSDKLEEAEANRDT